MLILEQFMASLTLLLSFFQSQIESSQSKTRSDLLNKIVNFLIEQNIFEI